MGGGGAGRLGDIMILSVHYEFRGYNPHKMSNVWTNSKEEIAFI